MEQVRYDQLKELLVARIVPDLREIRRRQILLQASVWAVATVALAHLAVAILGALLDAHS